MIGIKRNRYKAKSSTTQGRVMVDAMLTKLNDCYKPIDNRLNLCQPMSDEYTQMLSNVADELSLDKLTTTLKGKDHTVISTVSGKANAELLIYNDAVEDCKFMQAYITLRLGSLLRVSVLER
jgi:hypothetical protein